MNTELEGWLAAALREVPPPRRARLREEIAAHVEEAAAAHARRGLGEREALAAALADLGDPADTARALRRAYPPSLAQRLEPIRQPIGPALLLAALAVFGLWGLRRALGLDAVGSELGSAGGLALMLQVAALTLAVSLPLLHDDLDLAAGPILMLGAFITRDMGSYDAFWLAERPAALPGAILAAGAIGAAAGLAHGLLVVLGRLPSLAVTAAGGVALSVYLFGRPGINNMALASELRVPTLGPSMALLGLALGLCVGLAFLAARRPEPPLPPRGAGPGLGGRLRELGFGVLLLMPLMLTMGAVNLTWGSPPTMLILAAVTLATAAAARWLSLAGDAAASRERRRALMRGLLPVNLALLAALTVGSVLRQGHMGDVAYASLSLLLLLMMTVLPGAVVGLALTAAVRGVWSGRGRRWLSLGRGERRQPLARIGALAASGALAAAIGACVAAQGLRDNTFVLATSFYVLAPLAGLAIGGQHLLPMAWRPLGALVGGLAAAAITPLSSDNLASATITAILLAALAALGWRAALPPARALPAGEEAGPSPAPTQAARELHRRIGLA